MKEKKNHRDPYTDIKRTSPYQGPYRRRHKWRRVWDLVLMLMLVLVIILMVWDFFGLYK